MTKQERSEDLNPHSDDIEEKVRRMLDPRLPDEETLGTENQPASQIKIVTNDSSKSAPEEKSDTEIPTVKTAPELPSSAAGVSMAIPSDKKTRKVIVPVSHDDSPANEETIEDLPDTPDLPESQVRKIDVTDHGDSSEEVAEKLDEAIAELDPDKNQEVEDGPQDAEVEGEINDDVKPDAPAKEEPKPEPVTAEKPTKEIVKKTDTKTVEKESKKTPKHSNKVIDDPKTDQAVKDITSKEGDKLLEVEDHKNQEQTKPKKKSFLKKVLKSKVLRWVVLLLFLAAAGALIAIPEYRYRALNAVGVRASSNVRIIDITTGLPLKNVTVSMGDVSTQTNDEGHAELTNLLLGGTTLSIEKIAYESISESITIGWGSNRLGDRSIKPTGVQYQINALDFVSNLGIKGAQASREDSNATADDKGLIKLTLPEIGGDSIKVLVSAAGYVDKEITFPVTSTEPIDVKLVPNRKHVFVSNRSGNFDIYSAYVDGSKEARILKASGFEQDDLVLLAQPSKNKAAYVSTRTNNRNEQGNLTYNLLIINLEDNSTSNIVAADKIQLIGWSGDYIVYSITDTSDDSATRSRLISYDTSSGTTSQLASSNFFNDVLLTNDIVYFAPSSLVAGGDAAKLFSVKLDGAAKRTIIDKEIWKLFRNNYKELSVSAQNEWFSHVIGSTKAIPKEDSASNRVSRQFVESPNKRLAAWVDQRDGKGTLLIYDKEANKDKTVFAKIGLTQPVIWLNDNTIVFRVDSASEVADYVVNINDGVPIKITDVTVTGSAENWYYY